MTERPTYCCILMCFRDYMMEMGIWQPNTSGLHFQIRKKSEKCSITDGELHFFIDILEPLEDGAMHS